MRFTRLRLNGFKSFVDPTDLVIGDGLTGVVGPNGCGKSNLLEALRWVMGENRPTAMRGGGMEDVIFAGASSRNARNFAEVALHIDNTERLAPAAFNDADQLEIVRRITRDAGSAYKANGRDIRARDVQMLFADASTGAHSPALVRQGQIAELINAKPTARRRILEEAAGISGLYQRRHEAELKLKGVESNLARVDDTVEQLAAQLATLSRQARQAAKYREIGEALRAAEALLLHRRFEEADAARATAEVAAREAVAAAQGAERTAEQTAAAHEAAQAALPPLREEVAVAGAILQRLEVEREQLSGREAEAQAAIERLADRLAQIERDIERESQLNADATDTLSRLDAEAAELHAAGEGHAAALELAEAEAAEAADVLAAREGDLSRRNDELASLVAHHRSATRLVEDSRQGLARAEREAESAGATQAAARTERDAAEAAGAEAEARQARAQEAAEVAEAALAEVETARAEAQSAEGEARAAAASADGETGTLQAEVAALERMMTQDASEGAQVLDRIAVAPGYEGALGAALGDDLRAPEADAAEATGWAALAPYERDDPLPEGAVPLAGQVTAPPALARRIGRIGVVDTEAGAALQPALRPGQRLVSREGDLWRWDGYRQAAGEAASAATLRLQRRNRLEALRGELEAAKARTEEAQERHATAKARLDALAQSDRTRRAERKEAEAELVEAGRAVSKVAADRSIAEGRLHSAGQALERHRDEAMAARDRLAKAEAALAELGDPEAARAEIEDLKTTVEAARMTMMARRSAHDELRRTGQARDKRLKSISEERTGWQRRLENAGGRGTDLDSRREATARELAEARAAPETLAAERTRLEGSLETARARRDAAGTAMEQGETAERAAATWARDAERAAGEAREGRAAAEARAEAAREAAGAAAARIREELEMEPAALAAEVAGTEAPGSIGQVEAEIARLRGQRDGLGAVNLRAEEDAAEVRTEHDELVREKADLEEATAKLRHGIAGLNREGRERLLTAFEQVNANFATLFTHLFGGGEARLELIESDDPLEAGLEILCQPPGKKLSVLSLLSGGEQSLTAMALIFAVFLANPAPICVLDEVDAPLDDANVGRFCDLLDEMTRRTDTRFLIITHHAVTMARMDRLFGVTMAEHGVSQLVSVDLRNAEKMVA